MSCWRSIGVLALGALLETPPSFAAHPLVTEDTAVQGAGNVELENGFSWARQRPASVFEYQPQVSYGVSPTFDLILQPSWLARRAAMESSVHGIGDTNLDAKWRFVGMAPWSMAIRAGVTLSTNQRELGLAAQQTSEHVLLVLTYDEAPFSMDINGGYTINPRAQGMERNQGHFSVAVLWTLNEKLILTGETAADSSAELSASWSASALAGVIYTFRPGLDLDLGFQVRSHSDLPRTWLGGVTYRFAL